MTPDELDAVMRDASATYNMPPEAPRDAMWEAIARARADEPHGQRRPSRRIAYWGRNVAGIAAILLVGVLIGRNMGSPASTPPAVAVSPQDTIAVAPRSPVATNEPANEPARRVATSARLTPATRSRVPALRGEQRDVAMRAMARRPASDLTGDDAAYRLAVIQHLTRSEVVLTSFRSQARGQGDARMDAQFANLTRDLLGTTRLMIATHRNDDAMMTRLLEDLELVLMQISQYAADGRRTDLDAATQSIDRRNVITKLRSNIPAGT